MAIKNKHAASKKQEIFSSSPKRGAMEMSVGTIVTIVLLMAVLVLGLVMTKQIFASSKGAIDLTDQQLKSEIGKAFGAEDQMIIIYPESRYVEVKQESREGVGIGIRNILTGVSGNQQFSYNVGVSESTCGSADVLSWIELGKSASDISIPVGDYVARKVIFSIPTGSPLCSVRYSVTVTSGNVVKTDYFDVVVKAK